MDDQEEESTMAEAPSMPTTQTERRNCNRSQRAPQKSMCSPNSPNLRGKPIAYASPSLYFFHANSSGLSAVHQSLEHKPVQDYHRYFMASNDEEWFHILFGVHHGTPESYTYLRSLQERLGASSSSHQQDERPPTSAPTEEEIPAAQRRPRRNHRAPPC